MNERPVESGSSSRSTVCSRPEPSTWVTAGMTERLSGRTATTWIMNGSGTASTKYSSIASTSVDGRERPELLAKLDLGVDDLAHVGAPRIGEDAAVAERARAPLHAALEPADDLSRREMRPPSRRTARRRRRSSRRSHRRSPSSSAARVDRRGDRAVVERRSPVAVRHHEPARLARQLVPDVERRAERRAVVARRRLDVDLAERRALADLAVGDAVHRAAAGQAQPRRARPACAAFST